MKLSIIIPVYNERDTIREICDRVMSVAVDKEIILVDDGSSDGSREIVTALACDNSGAFCMTITVGKGRPSAVPCRL